MTFTYRAITANCGNDALGEFASGTIADSLKRDEADFYVINCQEAAFDKTRLQLQAAIGSNYNLLLIAAMETHTNFATQFHSGTGIVSFIIYKKNLDVTCLSSYNVRRSDSRLAGSAFNKGGLISNIVIYRKDTKDGIDLQVVSAHLDSDNSKKRNKDWQNINQAISGNVVDWETLVSACPHLRLSGYDANTRNLIVGNEVVNPWRTSPIPPAQQAFQQIPFAGQYFSRKSTYKTSTPDITRISDPKRPGFTCGGMLDFIGIADGSISRVPISESGVIQIGSEEGSDRDHDVLISPLLQYNKISDFLRVKGQITTRLSRVAPYLAKQIRNLQFSDVNKAKLLDVYTLFLSPKGLLHTMLDFHLEKLASIDRFTSLSRFCTDALKKEISATIFPTEPWLDTLSLENMAEAVGIFSGKKQGVALLFRSLSQCHSESGCKNRLDWYKQLQDSITKGTFQQAAASRYFKEQMQQEYFANYQKFKQTLKNFKPNTPNELLFARIGRQVLVQIDGIARKKVVARNFGFKSLSQLNSILDVCAKAVEIVHADGDITEVSEHLVYLSQKISGKSAPEWEMLGTSLLILASLVLVLTGILILAGGGSLLIAAAAGATFVSFATGVEILEQSCKKGLAKSLSNFQLAMDDLVEENTTSFMSPSG